VIDLEPLKTVLAEYDPNAPRCPLKVEYQYYDLISHEPCCRREGHDGECNNLRPSFGWPGFVTVSALVAEVERLRGEAESERADVVAWWQAASQQRVVDDPLNEAADNIERGEHRREETK